MKRTSSGLPFCMTIEFEFEGRSARQIDKTGMFEY